MRKYELEQVKEGAWIYAETPDGNTFSVFVNVGGSADGVIVEMWSGGDNVDSTAWEWSDIDNEEQEVRKA